MRSCLRIGVPAASGDPREFWAETSRDSLGMPRLCQSAEHDAGAVGRDAAVRAPDCASIVSGGVGRRHERR